MYPDNIIDDDSFYYDIDFQRPGEPIFDFWARVGTHFAPCRIYQNRSPRDNNFLCRVFAGGLISTRAREVLCSRLPHLSFEGALRTAEFLEASDEIAAEEARIAKEAARVTCAAREAAAAASSSASSGAAVGMITETPNRTGNKRVQPTCSSVVNKKRKL